jgi:hypothetical protein
MTSPRLLLLTLLASTVVVALPQAAEPTPEGTDIDVIAPIEGASSDVIKAIEGAEDNVPSPESGSDDNDDAIPLNLENGTALEEDIINDNTTPMNDENNATATEGSEKDVTPTESETDVTTTDVTATTENGVSVKEGVKDEETTTTEGTENGDTTTEGTENRDTTTEGTENDVTAIENAEVDVTNEIKVFWEALSVTEQDCIKVTLPLTLIRSLFAIVKCYNFKV